MHIAGITKVHLREYSETVINMFCPKMVYLSIDIDLNNWSKIDYNRHPAVRWKLLNINKLKENNPQKHTEQIDAIKRALSLS